jgi:DNA polymerase
MLWLDFETYSETPIKHGTYRYAASCEVMVATWAVDDGPVKHWDATYFDEKHRLSIPFPKELRDNLENPDQLITAHNSMFDRNVLKYALGIDVPVERWRDTMVQALAHSLPGSLGALCDIFRVGSDTAKHKEGKQLIQLFCKPRPKNADIRRATRVTHPEEWEKFIQYARSDIAAMREVAGKLPRWNYAGTELSLWWLDQRINDRGFLVDTTLARCALDAVDREQVQLRLQSQQETNGAVESTTQRDVLLEHILQEYGVDLPDLKKATLERRLEDPDLPDGVKALINIRLQASASSTTKYKALLNAVNDDERLRGTIQFCGAARTGRDAGRTFQPQNLPSRGLLPKDQIAAGIEALKAGCADMIFDNVMKLTSSTIRGCIIAPPGKKIVVADLSNIEGRKLAWLAEEEWKLQAFRDFDAKVGPDLYKLAYANSFRIDPDDVVDDQRQIGKVMELMLGYGGGVGAFITGAATYKFDIEEMANNAWDYLPGEQVHEAEGFLEWIRKQRMSTFGLSDRAFIVCDVFKRLWRAAHPRTASFWSELEAAVRQAINNRGNTFQCRKLKVRRDAAWLRIVLPSGRALCYPSPAVDRETGEISYLGQNQYSRKWSRIKTYGGKLAENCIAAGTLVLTRRGWIAIERATVTDTVWDGIDWVTQNGCIYRGNQAVLVRYGVTMTPDHKILTERGWIDASSCEGHNRVTCRIPNGYELPRVRREEVAMGSGVRLREDGNTCCVRAKEDEDTGHSSFLRVYAKRVYRRETDSPRHDDAPRLWGMAEHDRQVQATHTPGVAQLRRAGDTCLRGMGEILRELLARYGAYIPARLDHRTSGQHAGILPGELRLENIAASGEQSAYKPAPGYPGGQANRIRSGEGVRDKSEYATLSTGERLGFAPRTEHVYDLINCGPRSQFVVVGTDGPVIVHNCTQASSRDVFYHNMPDIEDAGYGIILRVHDELVTEVDDTEHFTVTSLAGIMSRTNEWSQGLPLAAAGFETRRYRKG